MTAPAAAPGLGWPNDDAGAGPSGLGWCELGTTAATATPDATPDAGTSGIPTHDTEADA